MFRVKRRHNKRENRIQEKQMSASSHRASCLQQTHLLENIMEFLQGGSHRSVTTHAAGITVEVDVGHPV